MPGILQRWRTLFRPTYVTYNFGPDAPDQVLNMTARQLYNTQDNLAAVVNFLANSIAQLPLKVYRRSERDERERDRNSAAALLLWQPNGDQTEYEFTRALLVEYLVFGCVYVWVIPDANSASGYQARIIPTDWITSTEKTNGYAPEKIVVVSNGSGAIEIPRSEFVRFNTYSPGNPGGYVSPVSALRQTMEEQIQAGRFRKELWRSSGRLNAQIIRPKDVQPWSDETRKKWVATFREAWGAGGSKAGSIPLMEDGMEIKPFNTSFKENQWMESVKLSREAVAAAYGINPSLVWHTDTQTYASSKDNARALYAECLGPILQMLQQRINTFLLPMVDAEFGTYVEFDLTEKLKGSFEERANILQSSVGGPWMTRNEARRDNNLPPVPGGDELIVPLNVIEGGQASPSDTHMGRNAAPMDLLVKAKQKAEDEPEENPEEIIIDNDMPQEERDKVSETMETFFKRQQKSILPKILAGAEWWNGERWDKELADDLEPVLNEIAASHGERMAKAMGADFFVDQIKAYIRKTAENRATMINDKTRDKLTGALDDAEESEEELDRAEVVNHEFDVRSGSESIALGTMLAKVAAGWGTKEAVEQARNQGIRKRVYKVWNTGPNARDTHAAMNGQRVGIDERFSNGADWPGDDSLDPDESCGCNCTTKIIIMEG